jgi:hypothetical protein
MSKILLNTVKKYVERLFINTNLYTLFSQARKMVGFLTQLIPSPMNIFLTNLYTFFIKISSVKYSFEHYSQGLYKLKLIKYTIYIRSI